jgi:uncharacterized protein (DUF433 family)
VVAIDHPFVSETPGVGGGYPQVRGTRIPVRCLVLSYRHFKDFERTVKQYPTLTREQVRGALDFYAEHPERVDEDIETNDRAMREFIARNGKWQG